MVVKIENRNIKKTEVMKEFEEETGKKAIWHGSVTKAFNKWKRGEKNYNENKQRISLYVNDGLKDEWTQFAIKNNYSTLSKLIRKAIKFLMDYQSNIKLNDGNFGINLFSSLSHELKEPLTIIKAYLQIINEKYGDSLDIEVISMLEKSISQCIILEDKIVKYLDKSKQKVDKINDDLLEYDILLIEDDSETSNLLKNYFRMEGFSCKTFLNGFDGLKDLQNSSPKVILLDILLPDISGYDVAKKIKSINKNKDIPIFFITAIPADEVELKVRELEVNGSILKPFNLSDFDIVFRYLKN